MSLVAESGGFRFAVGTETGSPDVMKYIQKRQDIEEIIETSRFLIRHGLEASYNFIFGLPRGDRISELQDTFRLACELNKINPPLTLPVSFYTPFPGSPMYQEALERGFETPKTLEEWEEYETSCTRMSECVPWRNSAQKKLIENVFTFFIPLAVPGNMHRGTITYLKKHLERHPLRHIILMAHRLAVLRLRFSFFGFPVESWLFRLWRRIGGVRGYFPGGKWREESPLRLSDPVIPPRTSGLRP